MEAAYEIKWAASSNERKERNKNINPYWLVFLFFLKGFNLQDWTSLLMVKARMNLLTAHAAAIIEKEMKQRLSRSLSR